LSFTYNDHVMHESSPALDLRNIGIALPLRPVVVAKQHPREYDGSHYCVLVSVTTATPQPGSDQINRAYEEGWVGLRGYTRPDGTQQRWALAFIGDTLSAQGETLSEVFVVDLPENDTDYIKQGSGPLQGTENTLPTPPLGVLQRRLTYTGHRRYPGVMTTPRHWIRSSPDGSTIAFLMRDLQGVIQLWGVAPHGGEPYQLTQSEHSIQSAFSWHPQGGKIALVCDNSVMLCNIVSGKLQRLTKRTAQPPLADAVVFSPDGKQIAFMREVAGFSQIYTVAQCVDEGGIP
jgi:hypothetical protein